MEQAEIITAIKGIIFERLELPWDEVGEVGPETPIFDGGLELDSFNIVELITQLEESFGFEFEESDFQEEHFRSVGALSRLVGSKVNREPAPS